MIVLELEPRQSDFSGLAYEPPISNPNIWGCERRWVNGSSRELDIRGDSILITDTRDGFNEWEGVLATSYIDGTDCQDTVEAHRGYQGKVSSVTCSEVCVKPGRQTKCVLDGGNSNLYIYGPQFAS